MPQLKNKVAIITGGARGIGRAAVKKFLNNGASVSAWDVNKSAGDTLLTDFQKYKENLEFKTVDVTKITAVQSAVSEVQNRFGRVDILINNAGITHDATLLKMSSDQFDTVIDVNLKGVFNCGQAIARHMADSGSGVIINTASVVALYGNFGQSNYVASKAGVIGLTKTWARELGRKGIRVNAVAPGFIKTEMVATIPEKVLTKIQEKTPLNRLGNPEDIANAFLFLASEDAAFITGAVLSVDGGLIL